MAIASQAPAVLSTVIAGICLLIVFVITVRMNAADAKRRGKSPLMVTLLVVLLFPLGSLVWLIMRPPLMDAKAGNNGVDREGDHPR